MESISAAAVRDALARFRRRDMPALPGRKNHLRAGVLVPIVWSDDGEPSVLLTERAATLRLHAGEIAFPGGRPEPGDGSLQHTALRESQEELGITDPEVLGQLSSVPLYTSEYRLVPFVASVSPQQELRPNAGEVAGVVRISITETLARGWTHAIPWTNRGVEVLSPVFEIGDVIAYGGTAHVLYELLELLAPIAGVGSLELRAGRFTWPEVLRWRGSQ